MERQIINDKAHDDILKKKGYVVTSFIDDVAVAALLREFQSLYPDSASGFYAAAHGERPELKKYIYDQVIMHFSGPVSNLFHECKLLGGTFVVKYPGGDSHLAPHKDWSITDEEQHLSYSVWVPLVEANTGNGAVTVIPYSHLLAQDHRGLNIEDPYAVMGEALRQYMLTVNMRPGEALVFDTRLVHGSEPNISDSPRVAVLATVVPENAGLRFYYGNKGLIEEYEANIDFYLHENILNGPASLSKIRDISPKPDRINREKFDELYSKLRIQG